MLSSEISRREPVAVSPSNVGGTSPREQREESLPPLALDILVVEDHADTRRYLVIFLRQLGHVVREAGLVGDALRVLEEQGCDVLISDVGLPDGCGWELLRRAPAGRVGYAIAMSGFGTLSDRSRSREAGYHDHLLKPFDLGELTGMLDGAAKLLGK